MGNVSADRLFSISGEEEFTGLALKIFRIQYKLNPVYHEYVDLLGKNAGVISELKDIPFLPIEFFRHHKILCEGQDEVLVFKSSGTTSENPSKHFVSDTGIYSESLTRGFRMFYGDPGDYCILAFLPSYLEREHSSLVYMARELIRLSGHPDSGFYLDNTAKLTDTLGRLELEKQSTLLLGVSFALADLAESNPMSLQHTIIMETGGMKGRRQELTRKELHIILKNAFGINSVHSEYGMTELLSQSYSKSNGLFHSPPWMKVMIRDPYDPLEITDGKRSGGINIIDLANIHSCSFIATQDIGKISDKGGFEVLGRFDHSDIRGCNLMVE